MKTYRVTLEDAGEPENAPKREVWIAPGQDSTRKGSGSASDPYRVSGPQQFDQVFKDAHNSTGVMPTAFRLMPGRYYTQGCWAHPGFATLWDTDALFGSTDVVIALSDPVRQTNGVERPDIHVLSAGSPYQAGGFCRIEDITIDGGFGEGSLAKGLFVTSGLRLYGPECRVARVEVDRIGGSYDPVKTPGGFIPLEAFGISFGSGSGGRVKDCVVRSSRLSKRYVSAFSAAGSAVDGVVFEDCLSEGQEDHAAFTVYDGTVVRNGRAKGFAYGIYNDTGDARRVLVDGGQFLVNRVGVGLVAVNPDEQKHGIRIRDAWFGFGRAKEPVGIELIGKPGWYGAFWDICARDCRFECDSESVFTLLSTDARASQLIGIRVTDSIMPMPARINAPKGSLEVFGMRDWSGEYFAPATRMTLERLGEIQGVTQ